MVTCPLCEDYEGTRGQVIAHASSKVDEDHKGVGGQQMKAMLDADEAVNGPPDESEISETPSENTDTVSQTDEQISTDDVSPDPTSETPPHEARENASADGQGDQPDEPDDCPECGSELVDVRGTDHLRHESGRDVPIPEQWDYVCSEWCQGGASGFEVSG